MQLGKFNSDRDSALHYLCTSEWGNDSFGDVESPTGYVWRISNTWEECKPTNLEFTSVLEEWLDQNDDVQDCTEFRMELVGHFLVQEDSNGLVHVLKCPNAEDLLAPYHALLAQYEEWLGEPED